MHSGRGHLAGKAATQAVIPAKAGIYSATLWKCAVVRLDSRFRGNDRCLKGSPFPNDTTTLASGRAVRLLDLVGRAGLS